MKTKLMFILILTLTVVLGGSMLYVGLLKESPLFVRKTNNILYVFNDETNTYVNLDITSKRYPRYISSEESTDELVRNMRASIKTELKSSTVSASVSGSDLWKRYSGKSARENKPDIYNVSLATNNSSHVKTGNAPADISGNSSGNTNNLTSPMMATPGYVSNGMTGSPTEPSNDYLPPEGAPVSDAVRFLILISVFYGMVPHLIKIKKLNFMLFYS